MSPTRKSLLPNLVSHRFLLGWHLRRDIWRWISRWSPRVEMSVCTAWTAQSVPYSILEVLVSFCQGHQVFSTVCRFDGCHQGLQEQVGRIGSLLVKGFMLPCSPGTLCSLLLSDACHVFSWPFLYFQKLRGVVLTHSGVVSSSFLFPIHSWMVALSCLVHWARAAIHRESVGGSW